MSEIKCIGCDTPIPYGATKCPMCGAAIAMPEIKRPIYEPSIPPLEISPQPILQKTCKHCSKQVPDSAIICAYCFRRVGFSQPEKIGAWFVLFIFLFVLVIATMPETPQSLEDKAAEARETQEYHDKDEAKNRALFIVKGMLKAPSTAKFSDPIVTKTANVFEVSGYVDSQNSFGAMLRTTFTVVFSKSNDEWSVVDFKI